MRETAARCASRSTSGHTRRWRHTPRRSSIACGRGRCRATERGPKTESRSSNAGSTRERLHEPSERRSRVRRADNLSIPCQARGPRPGPITVTITRGWWITLSVPGRESTWRSGRPHALPAAPRGRGRAHLMQAGRRGVRTSPTPIQFLPLNGVRFCRCPRRPLRPLPCTAVLRRSNRS